jgi:hypothetical protein
MKGEIKAAEAFVAGDSYHSKSAAWSDGLALWSYGTAIAVMLDQGSVVFNATKYSKTTSKHQNAARYVLAKAGIAVHKELHNVPMGTKAYELKELASR